MTFQKAPPEGAAIPDWFPWNCPECNELWWFNPSLPLHGRPCCLVDMKLTEQEFVDKIQASPIDQWRRCFWQQGILRGKQAALKAAQRLSAAQKDNETYQAVFEAVNRTLPGEAKVECDVDPEMGPIPGLPQWSIEPRTFYDKVSDMRLSFQVKPEQGAMMLKIESPAIDLGGHREFYFTSEGKYDGAGTEIKP